MHGQQNIKKKYFKFATDKKSATLIQVIIIKFDETVITWPEQLII